MTRWEDMSTEALFRELADTDDQGLRDFLIRRHDGLVRHVVKEYADSGEAFDDLMQVGRLGLIHAVDRFDADRGTQFATFAVPTIQGEIKRYFRDKGWAFKIPRRLQELVLQTKRVADGLATEHGRSPTYQEIAEALGVTEEQVIEAIEIGQQYEPLSFDSPVEGYDQGVEAPAMDRTGELDRQLESLGERAELAAALESLPDRDRLIIRKRYYEDKSQTEIAKELNISQMHVSRLQHRALARLRRALQDGRRTDQRR